MVVTFSIPSQDVARFELASVIFKIAYIKKYLTSTGHLKN